VPEVSEPEVSRRRDSNPEPPDYKADAHRLIWPPTSNSIYAAAPTVCLTPHGLTPFRVTNDVTPDRTELVSPTGFPTLSAAHHQGD
jgi:hypothetical protein